MSHVLEPATSRPQCLVGVGSACGLGKKSSDGKAATRGRRQARNNFISLLLGLTLTGEWILTKSVWLIFPLDHQNAAVSVT